jgi:dTDP-4-amino-4,6-dideoxygalactose transaminase
MNIPLVDLRAQYDAIRGEIDEAIARVLASAEFIMGPEVAAFDQAFASFCEVEHAVGVSSGTDALHLALRACGVTEGDEVITTPFTFIATAEAISMCGARPVFADIDARTCNLDPAQVERRITRRTRAIVPVHLYGQPADMTPILDIAARHGLRVIEDAAQAHGARYKGARVGTLGDAGCFSFYPGKNLGAYGDAGAVVTRDATIAARVRRLRDHGRQDKYEHLEVGFGNRLDGLQAAILSAKLPHLASWNQGRAKLARRYTQLLSGRGPAVPFVPDWAEPVWHLYVIRVGERASAQNTLRESGIATGVHYPLPLHVQPAYRHLGYRPDEFPEAIRAAGEVLSLPIYPELSEAGVERVAEALLGSVCRLAPAGSRPLGA